MELSKFLEFPISGSMYSLVLLPNQIGLRTNNGVIAMDREFNIQWEIKFADEPAFSLKNLFYLENNFVTVNAYDDENQQNKILGLDPNTGEQTFQYIAKWNTLANFGGLLSYEDKLFFGENPKQPVWTQFDTQAEAVVTKKSRPKLDWKGPIHTKENKTLVQVNNHAYSKHQDKLFYLDLKVSDSDWALVLDSYTQLIEVYENQILAFTYDENEKCQITMIQAESQSIIESHIWENDISEKWTYSHIQIENNSQILGFFEEGVSIFDLKSKQIKWTLPFSDSLKFTDGVLIEDVVVFIGQVDFLYEFFGWNFNTQESFNCNDFSDVGAISYPIYRVENKIVTSNPRKLLVYELSFE